MTKLIIPIVLILAAFSSCSEKREIEGAYENRKQIDKKVRAKLETQYNKYDPNSDSVDDPAIWVNKNDKSKTLIIGTDKIKGLAIYNMEGKILNFYEIGRCNNVDVRYDFPFSDDSIDIVATTNRTKNSIDLFKINKTKDGLDFLSRQILPTSFGEVYGFGLYKDLDRNQFYALVNTKTGRFEQWLFYADENKQIIFEKVRTFEPKTALEGVVADDENQIIYLGEENKGIWRFNANPDSKDIKGELLENSGESNTNIFYDIEGLAIYKTSHGGGYLIASSQGNFSYAIFERNVPNKYLGSFYIEDGTIDGAEETDGIEVINVAINEHFPNGFFIVQDGINKDGNKAVAQNFKLIDWSDIAKSFSPVLEIDTKTTSNIKNTLLLNDTICKLRFINF